MPENYYQNILYPLQDRVLKILENVPVFFYLTGGTALSRAYLNHRYSEDLDFFLNGAPDFKQQVNTVIEAFLKNSIKFETPVTSEGFTRLFIVEDDCTLKIDFVNDVPFRSGKPVSTKLFLRTDNIANILSNKITALSRYTPKDVADIVYISLNFQFNWIEVFSEASEKDLWVNPVEVAKILDEFPIQKMNEINWINKMPDPLNMFSPLIKQIIIDILEGKQNSLFKL